MYQHIATGSSQPKRRKKRPIHGVKTVDVTRGKSGYGFTISGQHPCILSCIVSGSPADVAGLKAGDYLVSVNGLNISKALHDDVVRKVGTSTGTLTLQVAENYNSSDSSDEEYHHRSKARYPNRVRPRHASSHKHGEKVLTECNQRERHSSSERHRHSHWSKQEIYNIKMGQSGPRVHTPVGAENSLSGSSQNSTPQFAGPLCVEKRRDNPSLLASSVSAVNHPLAKQAIVKSTSQSASTNRLPPSGSVSNHRRDCINRSSTVQGQGSYVAPAVSSFLKTSATSTHDTSPNNAFIAMEEEDDDGDEASLLDRNIHDIRAVVGYIGSIEMPSDANKPHVRLQSIRNAVRRLRVEQKIHTLVLMEVSPDGVKLTNAMGTTVAHYPVDRLAFSGVCPDDKRFFGIVTLHSFTGDDVGSDNGNQDDSISSGSCHVFMVDPEMRSHNMHSQKAKSFGISCTTGQDPNQCAEFPKSATPIILSITNLYKDRPGVPGPESEVALSQAFADPSRAAQRSCSNSSNSDSGLGFSKDDNVTERVCVVDVPSTPAVVTNHQQENWTGESFTLSNGKLQHCSPGIRTIPTPLHKSYRPVSDVRSKLDASTSSEESSFFKNAGSEKLNVRAMPGPVNGAMPPPFSFDVFDRQTSADNLRASMQKLYQQRQKSNDRAGHASSDQESNTSHGSDMYRSFSHPELQRSVSAPFKQLSEDSFMGNFNTSKVETVDMDDSKLSPRALLPPPFHQLRSPSAPPVVNRHNSDADLESDVDMADTSIISSLVDHFSQGQMFNFSSPNDGRRFSESFAVLHKKICTDAFKTPAKHRQDKDFNVNIAITPTEMAQASGGAAPQSTMPGRQIDLYSQEEKQYLRISTLVLKTGTRALRSFFDTKFLPHMLQNELNIQNNKDKLQRLKSKRIIHTGQWDTLYPPIGRVVTSINFDITLMALLLQEIGGINAPSTGWGTMPGGGDHSEGADIVRLRMYRNEMAHNNVGVLSNIEFQTKSTDIPQVIVRLGGTQFTTEINRILTCSVDETDMDLWREVRVELKEIKKEIAELKETDMELKNQEISAGKLKSWTQDGETFYPTEATKLIYNEVKSKRNCISIGLPGAGKTANIHYVALRLKNEGHRLSCVQTFKELISKMDRFGDNEKQVYVIDDVFGVHGVDETKRKEWCDDNKDDLERCLNNKNVSILCSSRKQVIDDHKLSNIKSRFTIVNISEGKAVLSGDERAGIFEKHAITKQRIILLTENKDQLKPKIKEKVREIECPVGCFPLVCHLYTGEEEPKQTIEEYFNKPLNVIADHLKKLEVEDSLSHLCLLLCLIYDNKLPVNIITVGDESEETKKLRVELLELCELPATTSRQTIHKKMATLLQTFVKREGDTYKFVHDIIHDAVIKHVNGLSSSVHQVIMSHCSAKFMRYRVHLSGVVCEDERGIIPGHDTESCINIRLDSFTCWGDRVLDIVRDGVRTSDQLYNDIHEGRCSIYDRRVIDNPWRDVFVGNGCVYSTEGQTVIVQALNRKSPSDVQTLMCTDGYSVWGNKYRHTALHWSMNWEHTHIVRQTLSVISTTRLRQLDSAHRYGEDLLSWAWRSTDIRQIVGQKLQEGRSKCIMM